MTVVDDMAADQAAFPVGLHRDLNTAVGLNGIQRIADEICQCKGRHVVWGVDEHRLIVQSSNRQRHLFLLKQKPMQPVCMVDNLAQVTGTQLLHDRDRCQGLQEVIQLPDRHNEFPDALCSKIVSLKAPSLKSLFQVEDAAGEAPHEVGELMSHRPHGDQCGLQTLVSCLFQCHALKLESGDNPQQGRPRPLRQTLEELIPGCQVNLGTKPFARYAKPQMSARGGNRQHHYMMRPLHGGVQVERSNDWTEEPLFSITNDEVLDDRDCSFATE